MKHDLLHLSPNEILPPEHNSRKEEDIDSDALNPDDTPSFAQLCRSIQDLGLLQPIVVMRTRLGYELVAGSRRLRAWKIVFNNKDIPCIIVPPGKSREIFASNLGKDQAARVEALARNLSENVQRKNIETWEKAQALYELQMMGLSVNDISRATSIGQSVCSILLSIRRKLKPELWQQFQRFGTKVLTYMEVYDISRLPPEEQTESWNKRVEDKRTRPRRGPERQPRLKLNRYLDSVRHPDFKDIEGDDWRAGCMYALEVALGYRKWDFGTDDRARKQVKQIVTYKHRNRRNS